MTLQDYLDYYENVFKLAYADAVTVLADKPDQLIIEQENSLSHLICYLKDNSDISNLKKAKGHLERAALDSYKIMWVEIKKKLNYYTSLDNKNIAVVFNLEFGELERKLIKFDSNIKEARRIEAQNIGKENEVVSEKYLESIMLGNELLDLIDHNKVNSYKNITIINHIKNNFVGFIFGIISSLIVWYFAS